MESAIELCDQVDKRSLCSMWVGSKPLEMVDRLHGFYMLTNAYLPLDVREELRLLMDVCWRKRELEYDELKEAA